VFEFGDEPEDKLVLFSLDGEETWELAVPEGTRELSGRRQTAMIDELEHSLEHGDDEELDKFFQKIILGSVRGPLVIEGLRRTRVFYPQPGDEKTTPEDLDRTRNQGGGNTSTPPLDTVGGSSPQEPSPTASKPPKQPKPRQTGGKDPSTSTIAGRPPASPPDIANNAPADPSVPPRPSVPNFIARLKQRAQPDETKE
jgi:hypothetical protein